MFGGQRSTTLDRDLINRCRVLQLTVDHLREENQRLRASGGASEVTPPRPTGRVDEVLQQRMDELEVRAALAASLLSLIRRYTSCRCRSGAAAAPPARCVRERRPLL
jgi:hypothetical protein